METPQNHTVGATPLAAGVKRGEFPFPLSDKSVEPGCLTWLRNHSNYMAGRGFLDYLQLVAVLVRGMILNFLIFLPSLLFVSVLLAGLHAWLVSHPFLVTKCILVGAGVLVLLYAIVLSIFGAMGGDSSVKSRDLRDLIFGSILIALLAAAAFESLSPMLEKFNELYDAGQISFQGTMSVLAAAIALLSSSGKLYSFLSGIKRQVALVVVGLVGLLAPLVVILFVTDFLLYGIPRQKWVVLTLLVLAGLFALALLVEAIWMLFRRADFNLILRAVGACLLVVAVAFFSRKINIYATDSRTELKSMLEPLGKLVCGLDKISNGAALDPQVAAVVQQFQAGCKNETNVEGRLEEGEELQLLQAQKPLIVLAQILSRRQKADLEPLRRELQRLGRQELQNDIKKRFAMQTCNADCVAARARRIFVRMELADEIQDWLENDPCIKTNCFKGLQDDKLRDLVAKRFALLNEKGKRAKLVNDAIRNAKTDLQKSSIDLSMFATEEHLYQKVQQKFAFVPGRAEVARLGGKEELAKQLTPNELLDEAFPESDDEYIQALLSRDLFVSYVLPRVAKRTGSDFEDTATAKQLVSLAKLADTAQRAEQEPKVLGLGSKDEEVESAVSDLQKALENRGLFDHPPNEGNFDYYTKDAVERLQVQSHYISVDGMAGKETLQLLGLGGALPPDADIVSAEIAERAEEELVSRVFESVDADSLSQMVASVAPPNIREALGKVLSNKANGLYTAVWPALQNVSPKKLTTLMQENLVDRLGVSDLTSRPLAEPKYSSTLSDKLLSVELHEFVSPKDVALLVARYEYGKYGGLETDKLSAVKEEFAHAVRLPNFLLAVLAMLTISIVCWWTMDVNLTSVHGLYRDRLATTFLIGSDKTGTIDVERDIDIQDICCYEAGSTAPYHLINAALNLQASKDVGLRGRNCDFFIFSKHFIGGARTGYCRTATMRDVFPQMDLASAMAVSAGAASPNMGRETSRLLVGMMTLLNIRLGFWLPNPGVLEEHLAGGSFRQIAERRKAGRIPGVGFDEVFKKELEDIVIRRENASKNGVSGRNRPPINLDANDCNTGHGLVGLAFSGGGIRSAAFNLGIAQALDGCGVFGYVDYLSTVSGGGYLGSNISALMRSRFETTSAGASEARGDRDAIQHHDTLRDRMFWRIRPTAYLNEMASQLKETARWVNLSDGGHCENTAAMELLRRRCKYIIIGDGEEDAKLHFKGLATLLRCAYLDLGIRIEFEDLDAIRLTKATEGDQEFAVSKKHFTFGKIKYPRGDGQEEETGYLLYLKSSFSGDENEIIREYRDRHPVFPHESTTNQMFCEDQFEAYRALGQHIAEKALEDRANPDQSADDLRQPRTLSTKMSFRDFQRWLGDVVVPDNPLPKVSRQTAG